MNPPDESEPVQTGRFPEEYVYDQRDIPPSKTWNMRALLREMNSGLFRTDFRKYFNRDPERTPPRQSNVVVAPADGILDIRRNADVTEFVVHLRLTDVHVQRVPLSGRIVSITRQGKGYWNPGDSNHRFGVSLRTSFDSPGNRISDSPTACVGRTDPPLPGEFPWRRTTQQSPVRRQRRLN